MIEKLREKALGLPMLPGVYIMMDKTRLVIYVGKAKQLKNRVSSYFHGTHNRKTEALVSNIADFDVIIANTEFEALVLESLLIKRHQPKYNILLRDDKGYPFIRVDLKSEYPVFSIVSKTANDGALYLGPYGKRMVTREAIDSVYKSLRLPLCGKKFPRDIGKERPCLNHHMNACPAYCQDAGLAVRYRESVEAAVEVLQGRTAMLIERLEGEMNAAAEALLFEQAAAIRDRIRAVQILRQKQFVIAGVSADTDAIGYYRGEAKCCFTVLHYVDGNLTDKDYELSDVPVETDGDAVSLFLRQYYERRGAFPKTVCLPLETADRELLEQLCTEKAGRRVFVVTPQRGDKLRLVETACMNAREEAERASTREEKALKTHEWLQNALKLGSVPERIEAFDVSNTGGTDVVASMTVFVRGKPYKKDYRRFKIKTVQGQDDYGSMTEVITRRIARYGEGDEKFAVLPDIMLIDGGAAHASAAHKTLEEAGLSLCVLGMVKDDRHRTRALVTPDGDEIGIAQNPAVFALIGTIQEETHRFAVEYHRALRSRNSYRSKLDEIDGVGQKRRNALLKAFGSVKAVAAKTAEELAAVVPKDVAARIFEHFHTESGGKNDEDNKRDGTGP